MQAEAPFHQWGIDFIGEIIEKSSGGHRWILVAIEYFTKWVEAILTRQETSKIVIDFILNNIVTRFGVLVRLIIDNVTCFRSEEFTKFCKSYGISISYASPYHPQENGKVESNNKNIMKIIKRTLGKKKRAWDSKLKMVVWADRITIKKSMGTSPFEYMDLKQGCQ